MAANFIDLLRDKLAAPPKEFKKREKQNSAFINDKKSRRSLYRVGCHLNTSLARSSEMEINISNSSLKF